MRGLMLARGLRLVELLRRRAYRVVELADLLQVTQRTVYRDLIAVEGAGIPLTQDGGRWRVFDERT